MRTHIILVLLLFTACTQQTSKNLAAKVGDYEISREDVIYKDKIIGIYYPQSSGSHGLKQLITSYTYAQILKNHGKPITDDVVRMEDERINKSTQNPGMLQQIKNIFGNDKAAYDRVFILPTFADRVIYFDFFLKTPAFHEDSKKVAQAFMEAALEKSAEFEKLAKAQGLKVVKMTVSLSKGPEWDLIGKPEKDDKPSEVPENVRKKMEESNLQNTSVEAQFWMNEVVKPAKKNSVHPKVIDQNNYWLVVRYLGPSAKEKSIHNLESVAFPKANYEEWLKKESAKISIKEF